MTSWKNDTKIPDLHTITSAYHAEINMEFEKKKKTKKDSTRKEYQIKNKESSQIPLEYRMTIGQ
jgi:hypothetical protein